jgi:isopentenyl-diphosphate delta-isomerase
MEFTDPRLALPGFRYRAQMAGVVEHEACPVLIARASGDPNPNPVEVADWLWVPWAQFVGMVLGRTPDADLRAGDGTAISTDAISPWCRLQVTALDELGPDPDLWPTGDPNLLPPALPAW